MDTLDIPEPQVLVHYPADAGGLTWHHRILVKKVTAGVWIAVTPDLELVRHNLLEHRHIVLDRNAMFPADRRPFCYGFDPVPRAEILALKRRAAVQAAILGDDDADMEIDNFAWVISEGDHLRFGQALTDPEVQQATLGQKGCRSCQWLGGFRGEG